MKHPVSANPSAFLAWIAVAITCGFPAGLMADQHTDFFERHIRPALIEHCYECHSHARGKAEGGLLLDSRPAMQRGGDTGPAVVPGRPQESLLLEAINYESLEMPPTKQLDAATIQRFEQWIQQGAVDPRQQETSPEEASRNYLRQARDFWAFRPREKVVVPQRSTPWGVSPIDRFVMRKLEEQQLQPVPQADRATWLRRVTFDLVGLPPTVEELDHFLTDTRTNAYEEVVDRLLASPRYGERWGRYWLDLARYADSNGADENHQYPVAWRYRDYVVAAYNADTPYDRMIREQLAGDLLPTTTETERRDNLTATGFLVLGPKMLAEQDKAKMVADIIDEQLDTFGKVFLGLTLGCARCHDHKFDPITARDYYALAGIFHSTRTMEHLDFVSRWNEQELPDAKRQQQITEHRRPLKHAQAQVQALHDAIFSRQLMVLSELMRKQLGTPVFAEPPQPLAEREARQSSEQERKPLGKFLEDSSGVFRVWHELSHQPSTTFAAAAKHLWQAVRSDPRADREKNGPHPFERRLVHEPVPTSKTELVTCYVNTFRRCREELSTNAADRSLQETLFTGGHAAFRAEPTIYLSAEEQGRLKDAEQRVDTLQKSMPKLDAVMATDETDVKLVALHVRGNHLQMSGDPVPRGVPAVLASAGSVPDFPSHASGRQELAAWLSHPEHPLTARVMVNRLWQGHFGHGLVRSPSNFGLRGEAPSHPALLDWLANEFVRSGWSIKRMHREIVLSTTYRLRSSATVQSKRIDPENRFLSHFPRRRLELEPIRDALLAIAGTLQTEIGGKIAASPGAKYERSKAEKQELDIPRRTIYLPVNRAALPAVFSTFDYVDPAVSLAQRPSTTVPHQTLFLMNHPLVMDSGERLAERIVHSSRTTDQRIDLAYKSIYGRLPMPAERSVADRFLAQQKQALRALTADQIELAIWTSYCRSLLLTSEFLYVD